MVWKISSPLNVNILITHERNFVMGATPMKLTLNLPDLGTAPD